MNNKFKIILVGFLIVIGFFLITEHRAHLYGFIPYSFLLLCLIMHLFMHGGHGNDKKGGHH